MDELSRNDLELADIFKNYREHKTRYSLMQLASMISKKQIETIEKSLEIPEESKESFNAKFVEFHRLLKSLAYNI